MQDIYLWCVLYCYFCLKQLNGTFYFVLILAVPVDKGGSVSPTLKFHVPSASLRTAWGLKRLEESGRQLQRRTFS